MVLSAKRLIGCAVAALALLNLAAADEYKNEDYYDNEPEYKEPEYTEPEYTEPETYEKDYNNYYAPTPSTAKPTKYASYDNPYELDEYDPASYHSYDIVDDQDDYYDDDVIDDDEYYGKKWKSQVTAEYYFTICKKFYVAVEQLSKDECAPPAPTPTHRAYPTRPKPTKSKDYYEKEDYDKVEDVEFGDVSAHSQYKNWHNEDNKPWQLDDDDFPPVSPRPKLTYAAYSARRCKYARDQAILDATLYCYIAAESRILYQNKFRHVHDKGLWYAKLTHDIEAVESCFPTPIQPTKPTYPALYYGPTYHPSSYPSEQPAVGYSERPQVPYQFAPDDFAGWIENEAEATGVTDPETAGVGYDRQWGYLELPAKFRTLFSNLNKNVTAPFEPTGYSKLLCGLAFTAAAE